MVCTGPANTANDPPLCSQCRDAQPIVTAARQVHSVYPASVVEDAWVSGSKAQSAALALKAAGAARVTVLALAKWLRYDWQDHRALIDTLADPYDATLCPVTGGACPNAAG